jgi:Phage major tail protein 2.
MAIKLGLDAKLFRGTAGTQGTIEVTNVKDVSLSLESGEADVTTRKAKGWKLSVATLKEASLEITILYDTEDEDFLAFKTAYFTNTPLSLFVTDGDTTAHGLDADFSVTGFTVDQPLEEAVTVKVTAKPTASDRAPVWV